jgi:hypothetical protein
MSTPEIYNGGDNQFVSALSAEIDGYLPELKRGVGILGASGGGCVNDEVLKGPVCGRVTRLLGYLLRSVGYDAKGIVRLDLDYTGTYPTSDHAMLLVTSPDDGTQVIADGAYQQFTRGLFLEKEYEPSEEVIVLPVAETHVAINSLVRLRNKKVERHLRPEFLRSNSRLYRMSDDELRQYYAKIWDIGPYRPISRTLEDDIADFRTDSGSVSSLTRELIQTLGLV